MTPLQPAAGTHPPGAPGSEPAGAASQVGPGLERDAPPMGCSAAPPSRAGAWPAAAGRRKTTWGSGASCEPGSGAHIWAPPGSDQGVFERGWIQRGFGETQHSDRWAPGAAAGATHPLSPSRARKGLVAQRVLTRTPQPRGWAKEGIFLGPQGPPTRCPVSPSPGGKRSPGASLKNGGWF